MTVLKFRVMYEEDDSVFRDVEILPTQSVLNFESIIVQAFNLPVSEENEFFLSDDLWHLLKPLFKREGKAKSSTKSKAIPALIAYIDDPHQKFVFKYSGISEFTFLAELLSITGQQKKDVEYPVVTRKQGASPYKKDDLATRAAQVPVANDDEKDEEEEESGPEKMEEWIDDESTEDLGSVSEAEVDGVEPADVADEPKDEEEPEDKNFEEDFDETSDDFTEEYGTETDSAEE